MSSVTSVENSSFSEMLAAKTAKVVKGGTQLEKILKLVSAVLKPFESIPILPALPVFFCNLSKSCTQATEISGGIKVLERPNDWIKGKWKESGPRGFVQLVSFTAAQALSTAKMICKFAVLILPSPITLARDSLFIASFTLLTVDEGKKLHKISKQMSKVKNKVGESDNDQKAKLQGKLSKLEKTDPKYKKIEKRIEQAVKGELQGIRQKKIEKLRKDRSDRFINIAFNIAMIATLVFSIVATCLFISQPYVLIAFAVIGVAAAALNVVKVFSRP